MFMDLSLLRECQQRVELALATLSDLTVDREKCSYKRARVSLMFTWQRAGSSTA